MTIKNRFVVAPLTIYESDANGGLTDAARNFWRDLFRGFGLFVMPFTNVHPTGIGFPSPNAFDASHLPTLREYTAISHEQGAKIVAQIAHAGSRANPLMTRGLDDIAQAWETGWAEFIALGKTVMLNPDLIELIANGREAEIHTHFDWQQTDRYRYTPAMLAGTRQGMDFYPPAKG